MMSGEILERSKERVITQEEIDQYVSAESDLAFRNPSTREYELEKFALWKTSGHMIYLTSQNSDLGNNPSINILDICGGPGLEAAYYAMKTNGYVINLDIDPQMIYASRERAQRLGLDNVVHIVADMNHLPIKEDALDMVTCSLGIRYDDGTDFETREAYKIKKISEFKDVVAPGGKIVIARRVSAEIGNSIPKEELYSDEKCMQEAGLVDALRRTLRSKLFPATTIITFGSKPE